VQLAWCFSMAVATYLHNASIDLRLLRDCRGAVDPLPPDASGRYRAMCSSPSDDIGQPQLIMCSFLEGETF
jgi:hypothetical protein